PRVGLAHSGSHERIDALGQVELELTVNVAGEPITAKQIDETAWPGHGDILVALGVAEHSAHAFGEAGPARFLARELLPSGGRERIEARLSILFGGAPRRADPPILLHSMERGIERAFLD